MTCQGCDREVTLIDGHFCGLCGSEISRAINDALEDVDAVSGGVRDVTMAKDGLLHIRIDVDEDEGRGQVVIPGA